MDTDNIVRARQPEQSDGKHFVRVFHELGDVHPNGHEPNKAETVADARRRGLVPTGGVEVSDTEELPDGRVRVTYRVPVRPSGEAVAVTTRDPVAERRPRKSKG